MENTRRSSTKQERLAEELADVLIYSYMLADNLDFDINDIIRKTSKNAEKYPVEKVKITIVNTMSYKELIINIEINTLVR